MKNNINMRRFLNLLAFIALVFAAVALTLAYIFNSGNFMGNLSHVLSQIAYALAFIVSGIYAFSYVRSKGTVCVVIYIIACVIVAIFLIIPMFSF